MSLAAFSSLPPLPPPFTSILSTSGYSGASTAANQDQPLNNHQASSQRRRHSRHHQQYRSVQNPNSLQALLVDESAIASRKGAIATYGYSWLRPAGVAKTMLGRREEEAEREEVERQMREQEEMEEEVMRLEALRAQNEGEGNDWAEGREAGDEVGQERDLDEEIPDADAGAHVQDGQDYENQEGGGEADLDDDIPDAGDGLEDEAQEEDGEDVEGETGITDEVEQTRLVSGDSSSLRPRHSLAGRTDLNTTTPAIPPPSMRNVSNSANGRQVRLQAQAAAQQAYFMRRPPGTEQERQQQLQHEQGQEQATPSEEDEQALAERDLDADILTPEAEDEDDEGLERDLDDDIAEAEAAESDGEGDWQHTDTELELEDYSIASILPTAATRRTAADLGHGARREADADAERDGDVSMDMSGLDEDAAAQVGRRSRITATIHGVPVTPATVSSTNASSSILHSPVSTDAGRTSNAVSSGWLRRDPLFGHAARSKMMNRLGRPGNLFSGADTDNDAGDDNNSHNDSIDSRIESGSTNVATNDTATNRPHSHTPSNRTPAQVAGDEDEESGDDDD